MAAVLCHDVFLRTSSGQQNRNRDTVGLEGVL